MSIMRYKMSTFSYVFLIYLSSCFLFSAASKVNSKCMNQDPCYCKIDDEHKLNISDVLDGISEKLLEDRKGNISYIFLGCKDKEYIKGNIHKTGSLIMYNHSFIQQNNSKIEAMQVLGNSTNIKFDFLEDENAYQIVYDIQNVTSLPTIRLLCDNYEKPFLKVIDESNIELVLSSKKVCVISEHHGLSRGSVFVIIMLIIAAIYFIGGGLILYFIRGARGIEVVPNIEFWKNLPGLVKDGAIFLFSGCRPNLVTTAETYDRI